MPNNFVDMSKLSEFQFPLIKKLSEEQEQYVDSLFKHTLTICNSGAGSGKTTLATMCFNYLLRCGRLDRIYFVVSATEEKEYGYVPGDHALKVTRYARPFIQALQECNVNINLLSYDVIGNESAPGDYKVIAGEFERGVTRKRSGIIIDEAQNFTILKLKKVLTRIDDVGKDACKVALIGHDGQIDINKRDSGFSAYISYFKYCKRNGIYSDVGFADIHEDFRGPLSRVSDNIDEYLKMFGK